MESKNPLFTFNRSTHTLTRRKHVFSVKIKIAFLPRYTKENVPDFEHIESHPLPLIHAPMPASSQSWNIPNPHLTKKAAPRITRRNKESPSFQRSRSYYYSSRFSTEKTSPSPPSRGRSHQPKIVRPFMPGSYVLAGAFLILFLGRKDECQTARTISWGT